LNASASDQHVDALEPPQLADEHEVARVRIRRDRRELRRRNPVVDDPHRRGRRSDPRAIHLARVGALEQDEIGARQQRALEVEVDEAERRARIEVERAAVRGIGAHRAAAGEPRIGAALGPVPVHHVGGGRADRVPDPAHRGYVAQAEMPAHRHPSDAESEHGRKLGQGRLGPRPAGRRIGHDADPVAGRGLSAHHVDDVAKQPADRSAKHVEDGEGCSVAGGHDAARIAGAPEQTIK
jgi:hypothetical protein